VPDGLFWTVLVPDSDVLVNLGAGTAIMQVNNLQTLDFVTFENDLLHGPAIPTTVSYAVQWSGLKNRTQVRIPVLQDGSPGFAAQLAQSDTSGATVSFTASEPTAVVNGLTGVTYNSDPTTPATVLYAGLGLERNGVFLPG
jgi:hypothetical protein